MSILLENLPSATEVFALLKLEKVHAILGSAAATFSIFVASSQWFKRRKAEKKLAEAQNTLREIEEASRSDENNIWSLWQRGIPEWFQLQWPKSMLRVILLANFKGGVGKTTISANLAIALASKGYKVLIIDFDYQGSLDSRFRVNLVDKTVKMGSSALLEKNGNLFDTNTRIDLLGTYDGITLSPGFFRLAQVENKILLQWLIKSEDDDVRFRLARKLLDERTEAEFDVVIIDTPPRLTAGTVNALCVSTDILIPTIADKTSAEAVKNFALVARKFQQQYNSKLRVAGVIPSMTALKDLKHTETTVLHDLKSKLGEIGFRDAILPINIPRRTSEAVILGDVPLYNADENCKEAFEGIIKSLHLMPPKSAHKKEAKNEGLGISVGA